jgi:hypothetical protein
VLRGRALIRRDAAAAIVSAGYSCFAGSDYKDPQSFVEFQPIRAHHLRAWRASGRQQASRVVFRSAEED